MSQRGSGYERRERDLYETPEWATEALLPHFPRRPTVFWEPACGSGKMSRVLSRYATTFESDIETDVGVPYDFLGDGILDLKTDGDAIVTNPPYDQAEEFCSRALKTAKKVHGMVAMLLRTDFDHAKTRSHLFRDCPAFAKKVVLTKRIVWFEPPPGEKGKSPSFNHAWFIWDWKHQGAPTLAYGP